MQLHDLTLEQRLLSALIKYPQEFLAVQSLFSEDDIYSEESVLHRTIFTLIKQAVEKGEDVDGPILAQRAVKLGINFDDALPKDFTIGDYIVSLSQKNVSENSVEKLARELKKLSVRRKLVDGHKKAIQKIQSLGPSASLDEIVEVSDKETNSIINVFDCGLDLPVNIFEKMESWVEERGNNPLVENGMLGPWEITNKIYGSLVKEGNITVLVSRAKTGKTTVSMDYCIRTAAKYDVPVLHLDNGEMSLEELLIRQCASMSGVPLFLIETGKWRLAGEEIVKKVRSTWKIIKNLKFFYYCVGGMTPAEMANIVKKFYYSTVGRGNRMILSFDYIKPPTQNPNGSSEWVVVGELVDTFKRLINKEIVFDGKPKIGMFTSVQANRSGIVTGKKSEEVEDSESVAALSDRISWFCSQMFILRKKTLDEIFQDGIEFGTHKLQNLLPRHLGEDPAGHHEPVKIGDSLRQNYINLEIKNFHVRECGDLREIAKKKSAEAHPKNSNSKEDLDF